MMPAARTSGLAKPDETYVGGKAKNRATRQPASKKAAVALVQRDGIACSCNVANVNAKTVRSLMVTNIDRASVHMTDESPVFYRLGKEFTNHFAVNHSAKQYVTIWRVQAQQHR